MSGPVQTVIEPIGRHHQVAAAIDVISNSGAVLITGHPGVGKTHLARRAAERFRSASPDAEVVHLSAADPAPRSWPYTDPTGAPLLTVLEDAHLLPTPAVARVAHACRNRQASLITTAPVVPPWSSRLVRDGVLTHLIVRPLDAGEIGELVHATLQGRVSADVIWAVWQSSLGNPRYAIDLVESAVFDGQLRSVDGTWLFDGPPSPSSRILDQVAADLASLPPAQRDLVDVVALGGPVPLDRLVAATCADSLDIQVTAGSLSMGTDDRSGRPVVLTAHARFGDLAAMLVPPARRRRLFDRLEPRGGLPDGPPEHLVRTAQWALSCGAPVGGIALLRAARAAADQARLEATETITTAALDALEPGAVGRIEALLLRSDARRIAGRTTPAISDARHAHAEARRATTDGATRAYWSFQAAVALADLAQFGRGDLDGALAIIDAETATWDDPGPFAPSETIRIRARSDRAMRLAYGGRFTEATASQPTPTELETLAVGPRVDHLVALAYADAFAGRLDEVRARAEELMAASNALGPEARWGPIQAQSVLFTVLIWAGRIDEATELIAGIDADPDLPGFVDPTVRQLGHGVIAGAHQDWTAAITHLEAAAARFQVLDFSGWLPLCLTWLATAQAASGRTAAASATFARARKLPAGASDLLAFELWDHWWRVAATLGSADAKQIAGSLVDAGRTQGLGLVELWGWHGLATVGDAGDAGLERLDRLSHGLGDPLPAARADHARSLIVGDDALAAACLVRLGELGYWVPIGADGPVSGLTERQLQVAHLATTGLTSAAIAERLFISKRTVDAHLGHIYGRLGITGRSELATVLSAVADRDRSSPPVDQRRRSGPR